MQLGRRDFLRSWAALPVLIGKSARAESSEPLRVRASRHNRIYGAAVCTEQLLSDVEYRKVIGREAGILVAEGETKRNVLQPQRNVFNFSRTDAILKFAQDNDQLMRGHTLVWHRANPKWLNEEIVVTRDEKLLTGYIEAIVGRYRGQLNSWDVVNEAIEPDDGLVSGLRQQSIWFRALGESYIETAFHCARAADPDASLYYNEANLEGDVAWSERRRRATLKLLERLISKNVPIDALGIQGHLKAYRVKYSDEVFSRFLDDVASLGLRILITEFDVADAGGPEDRVQRDADVASLTHRYLDVAFSKPSVIGCLTWGITDKYSWLSRDEHYRWPDGQSSRGLPFDQEFKRKPMWDAMVSAYDKTPI